VKSMTSSSAFWFRELQPDSHEEIAYLCEKLVYSGRSRFQRIDIIDTMLHGRMLFLDGVAQSAQHDEFIYHEMLVHPAIFSVSKARSVLIIGGAEGATLREVLRHKEVERVVMVEIDKELIAVCRRLLPSWHKGSFEDPRLQLVIQDGRQFLQDCPETFDAIIVDLSDPEEGGPALFLFTRQFYQLLRDRLNPGGCVTLQGEAVSPQGLALHARITNTLRSVFPVVRPYMYSIHSFHRPDAHILAARDPQWSLEALVERSMNASLPLLYFSPEIARAMFHLPPYLHKGYEMYNQILTDDKPTY
jgi:spermidine synthase